MQEQKSSGDILGSVQINNEKVKEFSDKTRKNKVEYTRGENL